MCPLTDHSRDKFCFLLLLLRSLLALPCLFADAQDISLPLASFYIALTLLFAVAILFFMLVRPSHFFLWWHPPVVFVLWLVAFLVSVLSLFGWPAAWIGIPILIESVISVQTYFASRPYRVPVRIEF